MPSARKRKLSLKKLRPIKYVLTYFWRTESTDWVRESAVIYRSSPIRSADTKQFLWAKHGPCMALGLATEAVTESAPFHGAVADAAASYGPLGKAYVPAKV